MIIVYFLSSLIVLAIQLNSHWLNEIYEGHIFDTLFLMVLCLVSIYYKEVSFWWNLNYELTLNHEIKRTQNLLRNLVPPNVFRGLLKGKWIADCLENVTLLFTDMCGFTAFSKERQPSEVVKVLSELFTRFDNLCLKHNVYKVHTIGDCYVILGYTGKVPNEKRDLYEEAVNVIEFGF